MARYGQLGNIQPTLMLLPLCRENHKAPGLEGITGKLDAAPGVVLTKEDPPLGLQVWCCTAALCRTETWPEPRLFCTACIGKGAVESTAVWSSRCVLESGQEWRPGTLLMPRFTATPVNLPCKEIDYLVGSAAVFASAPPECVLSACVAP